MFITAGVVLLLFCVYQLWWTNVESAQARDSAIDGLTELWQAGQGPDVDDRAEPQEPIPGGAWAILRIPRLGDGWKEPVLEGVGADELHKGIGHYPESGRPGRNGNVALAGHRATNGEPFRDLDRMRPGDKIVLETRDSVYTYVVDDPWRIVKPTQVGVVLPVPDQPGVAPTEQIITLTTCNPRWSSTERLIVHGVLNSVRPRPGAVATAPSSGAPKATPKATPEASRQVLPGATRKASPGATRKASPTAVPSPAASPALSPAGSRGADVVG
nr:class E sortase [Motilibacter deserti]